MVDFDPRNGEELEAPFIQAAVEACANIIACRTTIDLFEYGMDDAIEGPSLAGGVAHIEMATKSDVGLFIPPGRDRRAGEPEEAT